MSYYVIYGQEFSQSVLFVMFETNANEASSEYLSQYFGEIVLVATKAHTVAHCVLRTDVCARFIFSHGFIWRCRFCPLLARG